MGQGARGIGQGVYLKLAPEHGRRQQHTNDANQNSSNHSALDGCMVLLVHITSKFRVALISREQARLPLLALMAGFMTYFFEHPVVL